MSLTVTVIKVALPVPLRRGFDYLCPRQSGFDVPCPGMRITVPFGNRTLVGIIIGTGDSSNLASQKLKHAIEILDDRPLVPGELMRLCHWCASYYHHPIGEAFATTLPALLRRGKNVAARQETWYQLAAHFSATHEQQLQRAPRQAEIVALARDHEAGVSATALKTLGLAGTPLRALLDKGLVIKAIREAARHEHSTQVLAEAPLSLNPEQQQAVDSVRIALGEFACFLLDGVTGSGKTEVYLQAIEQTLQEGRAALVLVPEIGLTPQTVARFQHRFTGPVSVLHSGLTDSERLHAWSAAANDTARIIIGTRSSVFTPIPRLGIIIVDEEHDLSFKQQDGMRYSARDVAILRARQLGIPVLLGSATPSLESLYNVTAGRYRKLVLSERAGSANAPRLDLVDIRSRPLQEGISQPLLEAIGIEIKAGNQVLVFLNRRGFAPILMCHACGWMADCNNCDTRLTLHLQPRQLRCHHCDARQRVPSVCPDCASPELTAIGVGTERSEDAIGRLFPDVNVVRIDRDTMRGKRAIAERLAQVNQGEPCILVGTQMLAKGHHFPNVTLVAILEADSGLFSADFRGIERMAQLITQVAGRAGRALKPGRVLIQTHQADHPLIHSLIHDSYARLAERLLEERRQAELPPFRHWVIVRAEAADDTIPAQLLRETAGWAARYLDDHFAKARNGRGHAGEVTWFGPLPALLYRRNGRYRNLLIFQSSSRSALSQLLHHLCPLLETSRLARRARWSIDVDPQECF